MQDEPQKPYTEGPMHSTTPMIDPGLTFASVTDKISSIVLKRKTSLAWFFGFAISFALFQLMLLTITKMLFVGIGLWGVNVPVSWGVAILNFVWWIGIGHAGTLISAILLLLRQKWRTSINRFAEAMTLFAVAQAGMYPVMHLGRPWLAYWLFPYPNTMGIWPQFRSPLMWDVFAVSTYATVSAMFWFVGLIPDFATLRASLVSLWDARPAARRTAHAAGAFSAHDRQLRLRHRHHSGLARDHLSAVLRRRCNLRRLRDGCAADDSIAPVLRPRRLHHDAPHPQYGQGDARHRIDRRLWLHDGGFLRLVQRQ